MKALTRNVPISLIRSAESFFSNERKLKREVRADSRPLLQWLAITCNLLILFATTKVMAAPAEESALTFQQSQAIPWNQIGAKAGTVYKGDGLSVTTRTEGARLHCVFQRLEGEAGREGLWLTSTAANQTQDRFRVMAVAVGRCFENRTSNIQNSTFNIQLESTGNISLDGHTVRYVRPGLVEEYSVSMDGVRQDLVVLENPTFNSQPSTLPTELRVQLSVSGARVEATPYGAHLVLEKSGRKIAYSRLKVTDATGRELPARMEVASGIWPDAGGAQPATRILGAEFATASLQDTAEAAGLVTATFRQASMPAATLAVVVNDTDAVYPIRVDPTFSDANWISMGGTVGANNDVRAVAVDGSGNLYIGGDFTLVGDVLANNIAKWNGSSWSALGSGMISSVYALAVLGSDLYAGGQFTSAGGSNAIYIAKWNGTNWSALGSGMDSYVYALAVSGSDLYAGGLFSKANGTNAFRIAKWNGSAWSALGSGMNNTVQALAVSGGDLYAGGLFTTAGGSNAMRIAKWNGTNWSALGLGVSGEVKALAASGSDVVAGGAFLVATNTGGAPVTVNRIAKWDGTNWSALGSGINNTVFAVAASGSEVYAGGQFTTAGGTNAIRIAKWNGSSWSALGSGMVSTVYALVVTGSDLYAGGNFTTAGGSYVNRITKWNGSIWSALGSGLASGGALAVSGSDLYVSATYGSPGGAPISYISKWNGSSWSAYGLGLNNFVSALAVSGNDLFAGGQFTMATNSGGAAVTVNRIAKWDGTNWSALSSGVNDLVTALVVSGSNVYAGGYFTMAGPVFANRIARWNGSSWSTLNLGLNNYVYALAVSGSNVYAGGDFTTANGNPANRVAKWDGNAWSPLGLGVGSSVLTLSASGSALYAGGQFTTAGGSSANYIARWDGTNWSALGAGMDAFVNALAVSGSDVYAGGNFSMAGGSSVNRIAKWDGTNWSALGSGLNGTVTALAVSSSGLYVSGSFTAAAGKLSTYMAKAEWNLAPPGYNQITPQLLSGGQMRLSYVGMAETPYALDRTFSLSPPIGWNPQATNATAPDGSVVFTNAPVPTTNNFWRIRSVP